MIAGIVPPERGDGLLALALRGDPAQAADRLGELVRGNPQDGQAWSALGIACLVRGDAQRASEALRRALELLPGHVLSTAYLSIALQACGHDDDARELLDYAGLIDVSRPIAEAAAQARFDAELVRFVREHPTLAWERSTKATRGGWQTGELLDDPAPIARRLHATLQSVVHALLGEAAEGPSFRLSAWGVVLQAGGYQQPHVHQAAMLSGVYYAAMPAASGDADAGALRFVSRLPWLAAIPDYALSEPFVLRPQPGQAVVFPSYFWHETVPFESTGERVSIAFDVLPVHGGERDA